MTARSAATLICAAFSLASCTTGTPPPTTAADRPAPPAPIVEPADAVEAGVAAGPPLGSLAIDPKQAATALSAFRISCPVLVTRADPSRLTRGEDWKPACDAAATVPDAEARTFFATRFEAIRVGDGAAFATGYYEPEIAGSRTRAAGYDVPIYRRPPDLIDADLGAFSDPLKGKSVRGRVQGTDFVPYYDRAEIEAGALAGKGLEIAWAADPVEMFFLQVQGSGRLKLPDGGVMRIGYAGQNGRAYTGIGALLRQRNLLEKGQASMEGIMAWIRAHPAEGRALMQENKSFVFFRELNGPGPLGAIAIPVTPRGSVAVDPKFVPMGAPLFLALDRPEAAGLWVAQDTGGAIKGANRVDTFWGAGDDARTIAGGMSSHGTAVILVPAGTLARLRAEAGDGGTEAPR